MVDNEIRRKKQVILDFLEETPHWLEQMRKSHKISLHMICPWCGTDPQKIEELAEAIKSLFLNNPMYQYLSDCHNAPVSVLDDTETSYVCARCDNPCTVHNN